jgi:hypothetical protein
MGSVHGIAAFSVIDFQAMMRNWLPKTAATVVPARGDGARFACQTNKFLLMLPDWWAN